MSPLVQGALHLLNIASRKATAKLLGVVVCIWGRIAAASVLVFYTRARLRGYILRPNLVVAAALLLPLLAALFAPVNYSNPYLGEVQAATGINEQLNFQGRLLNSDGSIVADGSYNLRFKIYCGGDGSPGATTTGCAHATDEDLLWTETRESGDKVTITDGYFTVNLGSVTAISGVDWNEDEIWLSMDVGGTGAPSYDGELDPFFRMTSVPQAFNADQLDGIDSTGFVQLGQGSLQEDSGNNTTININKTGTGNIINLQDGGTDVFTLSNTGTITVKPSSNSTTALTVQQSAGNAVLTVDTTNGEAELGASTALDGKLVFYNSTNAFTGTLQANGVTGSNKTYTLPDETGTICLQSSANCGFVVTGGGDPFVQNGNSFTATAVLGTNDAYALQFETNNTVQAAILTSGFFGIGDTDPDAHLEVSANGGSGGNIFLLSADDSGDGDILTVTEAGRFILSGTANDASYGNIASISGTLSSTTNHQTGLTVNPTVTLGGASTRTYIGVLGQPTTSTTNLSGGWLIGLLGSPKYTGAGTLGYAAGIAARAQIDSGTVTTHDGFYIGNPTNSGTITTNYGLFVEDQTAGTNDYGIAIAGADTQALWVSTAADTTDAANGIAFGASRDTNLYRSAANTLKTDDDIVIQGGDITLGQSSTTTGSFILYNSSNSNTVTVTSGTTSGNFTITLPTAAGSDGNCLKQSGGTAVLVFGDCGNESGTLQAGYDNSAGGTTPEIKLDSTRDGVVIQDADTTIGADENLFSVHDSNGAGLGDVLFSVDATGEVLFQTADTDSTTALQVMDADGGTPVFVIDTTNERVGIGVSSPNNTIQVKDLIEFDNSEFATYLGYQTGASSSGNYNTGVGYQVLAASSTGTNNTALGYQALNSNTGSRNTAAGYRALYTNAGGNDNTAIGHSAAYDNTSGSQNVAIGVDALYNNQTGSDNVAIGYKALEDFTGSGAVAVGSQALLQATGTGNTAVGYQALQDVVTGTNNTALGYLALTNATSSSNTAVGYAAADALTTGADNVAIGYDALGGATGADENVAIGYQVLDHASAGDYNVGIGYATLTDAQSNDNTAVGNHSLFKLTTGSDNVAFGSSAGRCFTTGSNNIAIGSNAANSASSCGGSGNVIVGHQAGNNISSAANNVFIGYQAGDNITTGSSNIAIGYGVDPPSATGSDQLNIGGLIYGDMGTNDFVGIDFSSPASALDVNRDTSTGTDNVMRVISDYSSSENVVFRVNAQGDVYSDGTNYLGSGADIAENYRVKGKAKPGDVVMAAGPKTVKRSNKGYQKGLVGIVTTDPGIVLAHKQKGVDVALAGRVPVKVTAENGPIHRGDLLTSSEKHPGRAMKATEPGPTIGVAMQPHKKGVGKIEVFVNLDSQHPNDDLQSALTLDDLTTSELAVTGSAQFGADITVSGTATADNLVVNDSVTTTTLAVTETIETKDLVVSGHIITAGDTPTITAGPAAGTNPDVTITGNDTAGMVTVRGGGEIGDITGVVAGITFHSKYGSDKPRILLTAANQHAAESDIFIDYGLITGEGFKLKNLTELVEDRLYKFNYLIVE